MNWNDLKEGMILKDRIGWKYKIVKVEKNKIPAKNLYHLKCLSDDIHRVEIRPYIYIERYLKEVF